jgi:hypothetical protein
VRGDDPQIVYLIRGIWLYLAAHFKNSQLGNKFTAHFSLRVPGVVTKQFIHGTQVIKMFSDCGTNVTKYVHGALGSPNYSVIGRMKWSLYISLSKDLLSSTYMRLNADDHPHEHGHTHTYTHQHFLYAMALSNKGVRGNCYKTYMSLRFLPLNKVELFKMCVSFVKFALLLFGCFITFKHTL